MSTCFEARETDDVLNICCKKQVGAVGFAKVITAELLVATDIAPGSHQETRIQAGHMVPQGSGHGGTSATGRACGVLPNSAQWQIGLGADLGRERLTAHFFRCAMCLANSVTSPICFPIFFFLFVLSCFVLHGQFCSMKFAELK